MSTEVMKMALEALESDNPDIQLRAAIALRQAIAEAKQAQPVAITEQMAFAFHNAITDGAIGADDLMDLMRGLKAAFAHITAPPQRKPLDIQRIKHIATYCGEHITDEDVIEITRRVEAAHGIGEFK